MLDLDQEMEKLAQIVALRAQRKLGRKPRLQLVGNENEPDNNSAPQEVRATLPSWATLDAVDVSPRAVKMEEIMRIANTYRWQVAITHFLQTKGVPYMSDLSEPQLDDLHDRMLGYVDAAETGCSLADSLPAW